MKDPTRIIPLILALALGACAPATSAAPTPLPSPTGAPTPVPGALFVDPGTDLGGISPFILGTNHGPWIAIPFGMMDAAEQSGVTAIRFPGGEWGDNNNLKPYEIDQFMLLCGQLNAEPVISVRLKNGTPETAAEMVRYTNIEKGYGVRYWIIGNEPTLYAAALRDEYDTERFNQEWRTFYFAMKAVDPDILIFGPEVHQFTADPDANPRDSSGRDWMIEFLRANGDLVDVVSFHRYPFPKQIGDSPPTRADLRANSPEWDDIIIHLRSLIHEITGRDIPIAITEVSSNWSKAIGSDGTPESFYHAIWWADVLGQMTRQRVFMVNQWLLASSGGYGGWGLVGRGEVRPTYYVYAMYRQFGSQLVYASSDDPLLSIYAAKRADGALTVMVINLSDQEKRKALQIAGMTPLAAETWLFDAEHEAENLGALSLPADGLLVFPPESISLYVLNE